MTIVFRGLLGEALGMCSRITLVFIIERGDRGSKIV